MQVLVDSRPGGIGVVQLVGRLDLLAAGDVRQQIAAAITAGNRRLIVDLAEVSFIDSSGLGALIGGLKAARLAGGDLRIARPNEQAKFIFELTALNRVLRLYGTVEEALVDY